MLAQYNYILTARKMVTELLIYCYEIIIFQKFILHDHFFVTLQKMKVKKMHLSFLK